MMRSSLRRLEIGTSAALVLTVAASYSGGGGNKYLPTFTHRPGPASPIGPRPRCCFCKAFSTFQHQENTSALV
ncbi:hypothetical protein EDB81DRAFT_806021 [Dactylonectria macrodidyma]|uniref:Secreted protein n=1 Tax=Dactylonectria macrodidyma TaxID=307937 RepID=A0A9P9E8Y0_9HYPO|nr:hypothetical protein EDB81DRAFT_806021 [Dactylonectria macrodidyma]